MGAWFGSNGGLVLQFLVMIFWAGFTYSIVKRMGKDVEAISIDMKDVKKEVGTLTIEIRVAATLERRVDGLEGSLKEMSATLQGQRESFQKEMLELMRALAIAPKGPTLKREN